MGQSRRDLREFPDDVKDTMGQALLVAQKGGKSEDAKPLKGFRGAGVLEVVDDFDGSTFWTVCTVRFREAVYVLHTFQKKSTRGIATLQREIELIRARLAEAEEDYERWLKQSQPGLA